MLLLLGSRRCDMRDSTLDDIREVTVSVERSGSAFAEVERRDIGEVLEPLPEIALVGETQQVGNLLDGHVCVFELVACID